MPDFNIVKQEIESILPKSPLDFELAHGRLVLKWILEINPAADEALKIAALSHDIDRAMTGITEKDLVDYSKINEFKKEHCLRSASFIVEILRKHGYDQEIIDKVKHLVENHEFGGDKGSDMLMSADSLAYFDYNIPFYLERNGEERTKEKIRFMYNRLSPEAQKLVAKINFADPKIAQLVEEALV